MTKIPVYILAGGRSSRFGTDKARHQFDGQPLISQLAEFYKPFAEQIVVVADRVGKYDDLGLTTIADEVTDRGPLSGLNTALHHCTTSAWLLLSACDWVGLQRSWIDELLSRRDEGEGMQAIAYAGEHWEPLLSLYHYSILGFVTRLLARESLSLQGLLDTVDCVRLPLPADFTKAANLNAP